MSKKGALRPHPDVVYEQVDGDVLLVHLGTNRIYNLNETGARMWQLLTSGHPEGEITEMMLDEFDVDRSVLETEIDSLLAMLVTEKLVARDR